MQGESELQDIIVDLLAEIANELDDISLQKVSSTGKAGQDQKRGRNLKMMTKFEGRKRNGKTTRNGRNDTDRGFWIYTAK